MFIDERPNIVALSTHLYERYASVYPRAQHEDLVAAVEAAQPIDPNIAARLVGRAASFGSSCYLLHAERTGLFAISDGVVVTFLMFYGYSQHKLAVSLFGFGARPTAELGWVNAYYPENPPEPEPEPDPDDCGKPVVMPRFDQLTVAGAVAKAIGTNRPDALRLILDKIDAGKAYEAGKYSGTSPKPFAVVHVKGVAVALALEASESARYVRAVLALTPADQRALSREGENTTPSEAKAARLLRARGWTVEPPKSKP